MASRCETINPQRGNHLACSTHGLSTGCQFFRPPSQWKHLTLSCGPTVNDQQLVCSSTGNSYHTTIFTVDIVQPFMLTLPLFHHFHEITQTRVLCHTGLFDVTFVICRQRLGLFGHVAQLQHTVPTNQILRICTKTRDSERPSQEWRRACGRPATTWTHQICRDTGVTVT